MRLAVEAWRLRQAARRALERGDHERALGLASDAQHVHHTPCGDALRRLTAWLTAESSRPARRDTRHETDLDRS
jgi:hypothetical protein